MLKTNLLQPTSLKRRFHWRSLINNRQDLIALALISCLVVLFFEMRRHDMNLFTKEGMQEAMAPLGHWGPLVYMGVLALSVVISQIPGLPMAYSAGALWGPWMGGLYTVLGGFFGAMVAYFIGYTLGQSSLRHLSGRTIQFSNNKGHAFWGWMVFISRLLPVVSFDLVSYGAGVAKLSVPIYATATFFGMIPSVLLITYMGDTITMSSRATIVFWVVSGSLLLLSSWKMRQSGRKANPEKSL
ncbi:MAG: TVP38/TMEM64 family protein [Cyanobacteria bacterium J06632_3]